MAISQINSTGQAPQRGPTALSVLMRYATLKLAANLETTGLARVEKFELADAALYGRGIDRVGMPVFAAKYYAAGRQWRSYGRS